jgi:hypothetical protein
MYVDDADRADPEERTPNVFSSMSSPTRPAALTRNLASS